MFQSGKRGRAVRPGYKRVESKRHRGPKGRSRLANQHDRYIERAERADGKRQCQEGLDEAEEAQEQ
mgnify:CR=1 FL=1